MSEHESLVAARRLNDEAPRRALVGATWKRDVSPFPHRRNLQFFARRFDHQEALLLASLTDDLRPRLLRLGLKLLQKGDALLGVRYLQAVPNQGAEQSRVLVAVELVTGFHLNLHAVGTVT